MAISIYDTRSMIQLFEEIPPVRTFLLDTFFSASVRTFNTEHIDIDIIKGTRRLAPFVSPRIGGKTVERQGFITKTYKPPLLAPDTIITTEDLQNRLPGEHIYSGRGPTERQAWLLGRDMAQLNEMITRREEWMASQALFKSKIVMKGEGVDEEISFGGETNKTTLTAGNRWSEATSDPINDLVTARRKMVKTTALSPDTLVLGTKAIDSFLRNASVQKLLDNRRVDLGRVKPSLIPGGVTYYGNIREIGCDILSYDEWYLDEETGEEMPMVPEEELLLGSSKARTELSYGAVFDVNVGHFALPRVPKSWIQHKPSARFLQISSRPIPVPIQIDAFQVIKVVS